jgi:hypothetical protein
MRHGRRNQNGKATQIRRTPYLYWEWDHLDVFVDDDELVDDEGVVTPAYVGGVEPENSDVLRGRGGSVTSSYPKLLAGNIRWNCWSVNTASRN